MLENGKEYCTCKRKKCPRHGDCMACMEYHRLNSRYAPYCKRTKNREKQTSN